MHIPGNHGNWGLRYHSSAPRNRGGSNAIALAVAHGHTDVRHKLLQHQPSVKSNDMLSLQEILAEGDV